MTNYDKYINSTSTHYISNSCSNEHGDLHGGQAGDQTELIYSALKPFSIY